MAPRFPHRTFVINWLKALMLSPGMLFPASYLLIYLSTNIYLNADFKQNLSQSITQLTGNTWQISINSLTSGPVLDSMTLNHIELTPVVRLQNSTQHSNHSITITSLKIACPELQNILFSRQERLSSTKTVCEKILSDKRLAQ
jgi:hypothetical protein